MAGNAYFEAMPPWPVTLPRAEAGRRRRSEALKSKAAREGQRGSSELSGAQRVNRIGRGPCVISEGGCEQLGPSLRCELTQVFLEFFKRRLFRDQFSNKRCGNFLVEIQ
jgi:hypothetical protein